MSSGQLVVVTAIVSGNKGDGQVVNMHVWFSYPLSFCPFILLLFWFVFCQTQMADQLCRAGYIGQGLPRERTWSPERYCR